MNKVNVALQVLLVHLELTVHKAQLVLLDQQDQLEKGDLQVLQE